MRVPAGGGGGGGWDESTLYISVKHFVSSTLNVVALRE